MTTKRSTKSRQPWATRGAIGGIRARAPSRRHQIDLEGVRLIAELFAELAEACRSGRHARLDDCPGYRFLERVCYATGFVAPDMRHLGMTAYHRLLRDAEAVRVLTFPELRRFIHTIWRAERHADVGSEVGGGQIHEAAQSGSLAAIARRLFELVELAVPPRGQG